jgi:hypothetical protein
MMDGDRSILKLNPGDSALHELFRDEMFVGNADEFCALPPPVDAESLESLPCGPHCLLHFALRRVLSLRAIPLVLWQRATAALHRHLAQLGTTERSAIDPLEGPSTADCEKSFARSPIPSVNLLTKKDKAAAPRLVQIQLVPAITGNRLSGMGAPAIVLAL